MVAADTLRVPLEVHNCLIAPFENAVPEEIIASRDQGIAFVGHKQRTGVFPPASHIPQMDPIRRDRPIRDFHGVSMTAASS
ncbi:hypothetical protein [Streptomyces sp. NPDC005336]|uniref:hypothetical protein n=1 Tax=Streptomyces sp. NPDC005336 TaxID=3157035 RepID=UPI0033A80651